MIVSSHREAPEIARIRSPTAPTSTRSSARTGPDTVTLIANYVPLQEPAAAPNFYEFGDDVRYEIHIDNNGDGQAGRRRTGSGSTTRLRNPGTFLYNTGPILSLDSPELEPPPVLHGQQGRRAWRRVTELGAGLACPPCNIGPLSHPELPEAGRRRRARPGRWRQGVRRAARRGFYVDLGSIFDLANLRPFQQLHNQFGMNVFSRSARRGERDQPPQRALHRHPGAQGRPGASGRAAARRTHAR